MDELKFILSYIQKHGDVYEHDMASRFLDKHSSAAPEVPYGLRDIAPEAPAPATTDLGGTV